MTLYTLIACKINDYYNYNNYSDGEELYTQKNAIKIKFFVLFHYKTILSVLPFTVHLFLHVDLEGLHLVFMAQTCDDA